MLSLLPRIYYTGASSLQSMACSSRLAHPPRRHCGRVAVSWAFWASWSTAPPRLDLAGQGKHFSVKEQKQQRMDWGGRSNGDSNSDLNLSDWAHLSNLRPDLADDWTPTKADKLGRLASLYPDRNPSRCLINKTRVKQTDGIVSLVFH